MSVDEDTESSETTPAAEARPRSVFVTTHWSVVLKAGRQDTPQATGALEQLCRVYWYPLYAYVRRRGYSPPDAQDLTQEFFARLLERNWLARADHARGRFRTFLLTAMERFLANEWDKVRALKRGGGQKLVPLQLDTGESQYTAEPADLRTPEQIFERRWALALLGEVMQRLEAEYRAQGKTDLFATLRPCLVGDREILPYPRLSAQLGLPEGAVRVAVHRLRQRYRELLRAEIAHTVASPEEVDAEMRHLFNVLVQGGM
jgi:RNA polymerase sigma factor (sigma-70 family)